MMINKDTRTADELRAKTLKKNKEDQANTAQGQSNEEDNNVNTEAIGDQLAESMKILTPAWPLQNTVAVNPFWNLRSRFFCDVLSQLQPVLHQQLLMPIEYFREKYSTGEIQSDALEEALQESRGLWKYLPRTVPELVNITWGDARFSRHIETIAEITPANFRLYDFVIEDIGKFASAYFDQSQALIKFPWKSMSFWQAWNKSQRIDRSMMIAGFTDAKANLEKLAFLSPDAAIKTMLEDMGLTSKTSQHLYLQRASASVLGWGSQFRYQEWQKSLGYAVQTTSTATDLLAVRIAYDYLIFKQRFAENEAAYRKWSDSLNLLEVTRAEEDEYFGILYTWQLALELSYQRQVGARIARTQGETTKAGRFQLVFCIDVRSEMIRRHVEVASKQARTAGFAGFFATAIDYKKCDEKSVGHRLPVLLTPAITIIENPESKSEKSDAAKQLTQTMFTSYFRNLRKMPLSSFVFVELFGIFYVANMLRRVWRSLFSRDQLPQRFVATVTKFREDDVLKHGSFKPLTVEEKAAFAAGALRHMGIKNNIARLNVIVGHGADTANNAFGSSLDCGACGGHAGDINARFLVSLLNSNPVREQLAKQSILIGNDSYFVAAVHETVTDEVYLLDEDAVPEKFQQDLEDLKRSLGKASDSCRKERQGARSTCLDHSAKRRSTNWSEVRPEWGLSGNACFVVAPRSRTVGQNLSSRAFLHDYHWQADDEFKTLELIMTAPMVVTNWINMQYYGSVVAPQLFGSGNKILHNLTNESGVVEGNGGDLRVGLPLQSVHDGEKFVHDPVRLSVFIEAPQSEIEKIIQKHVVVHDLVVNQWLHIIHIDTASSQVSRRLRDGTYAEMV